MQVRPNCQTQLSFFWRQHKSRSLQYTVCLFFFLSNSLSFPKWITDNRFFGDTEGSVTKLVILWQTLFLLEICSDKYSNLTKAPSYVCNKINHALIPAKSFARSGSDLKDKCSHVGNLNYLFTNRDRGLHASHLSFLPLS